MTTRLRTSRLLAVAGSAALALGICVGPTSTPARADHAQPPGPVNAGNTFRWGFAKNDFRFVGPLKHGQWRVHGPGRVRNQHGMLTLNTARRGTVSATQITRGHAVGRWEIRLRSARMERGHRGYRVLTELVPAGGRPERCGARNVALEAYTPGARTVDHYIRSLPDHEYSTSKRVGLHDNQWHTFAVEVTRHRISWFVDAHVISSERRDDALSGVPFAVRFTMQGVDGVRMNRSRMQMDWLRYWTLERPNAKSTKAPAPTLGTYEGACG